MLIDYENVQPSYMAALDADHFHVLVFVGASQTKVTYEVASALQEMGDRAEYIKISSNGSNALDFHSYSVLHRENCSPRAGFILSHNFKRLRF